MIFPQLASPSLETCRLAVDCTFCAGTTFAGGSLGIAAVPATRVGRFVQHRLTISHSWGLQDGLRCRQASFICTSSAIGVGVDTWRRSRRHVVRVGCCLTSDRACAAEWDRVGGGGADCRKRAWRRSEREFDGHVSSEGESHRKQISGHRAARLARSQRRIRHDRKSPRIQTCGVPGASLVSAAGCGGVACSGPGVCQEMGSRATALRTGLGRLVGLESGVQALTSRITVARGGRRM